MREIKFRAWDKYNEEMLQDVQNEYDSTLMSFRQALDEDYYGLMQFTGLKDKNGKEIYEGDIVKTNLKKYTRFYKNGLFEVYYNTFLCHFALCPIGVYESNHKNGTFDAFTLTGAKTSNFEAIGNIYENPGLLEREVE